MYIFFSVVSGAVAFLQQQGLVGALGRDLWGRATAADGSLRGSGLLGDPNFLAVLLASSIPLIMQWHRLKARLPALAIVTAGLLSTNSRAGFILALVSVVILFFNRQRRGSGQQPNSRGRGLVVTACIVLMIGFAANVGGQRDRVLDGLQVAISGSAAISYQSDAAAEVSASDRREYAEAWMRLGVKSLPFGAGSNAQDFIETESGRQNAAHNNFIQLFGQGGIAGLLIGSLTLAAAVALFRHRNTNFALTGLTIVLGGLFLSYPGTALLAFPIGVADALAKRRSRSNSAPTATQSTSSRTGRSRSLN
ncbi:O-antigen ligase family protein [Aeromicrobium stalagmiti]|uniref:O-antigen ligase family protein n=1 Tax=Aeromicrobium stalagmiti TaxID=2738988 RepID=UPI001568D8CB|nr:O-antigen ligase family protein [Aeromicrobium stalagmiti]NRQ49128.1 O-antigen ligase family protein [Aeromicrobium stalagmiti]